MTSKRMIPLPENELLVSWISYDPESGVAVWKERTPLNHPEADVARWNKRFAGKPAGTKSRDGYSVITLQDVQYKLHRVLWALYHGTDPEIHIDHVNGDRSDNRIKNMRLVSPKENARNRKKSVNNTSGYQGVYLIYKRWCAFVSRENGREMIGSFKCKTAAIMARMREEKKAGYHKNHGRER